MKQIKNWACNGGSFNYEKYLPQGNKAGKWLPKIEDIQKCSTGYHLTLEPHKWAGNRVFLCEYKGQFDGEDDKIVCQSFRFLREITVTNCIDPKIYVRIANLYGANLSGANKDDLKKRGAINIMED